MLFCCLIKRSQGFEIAAAVTKGDQQISLEKVHHLLGHINHYSTIDTAKHLGWGQLKNSGKIYQPCAKAKAKQKSVPQSRRAPRSTIPNERIYHDLATVKAPADVAEKVSKPNWHLIVDKETDMKFTTFHKNKDDILDNASTQLKVMEQLVGKEIQIWQQDNAGENMVLEQNMKGQH